MIRPIYLDAAASTQLDPEVLNTMVAILRDEAANPSSAHWAGRAAADHVDQAREQVAALAHRGASSVIFTSGATEANALAIRGALGAATGHRRGIVSSVTEHPAVLEVLHDLERAGTPVTLVPVCRDGRLDLDQLAAAVDDTTLLVTVMAANNETGVLNDLAAITEHAHSVGAYVHTDASQLLAWGALPEDHDLDLITVSGHKMHGPQGVGALIADREVRRQLIPVQLGGGQEHGLRSGTINVAGVAGLGAAATLASDLGSSAAMRVAALRDELHHSLEAALPAVQLNGSTVHRLPGTLNLAFGDDGDEVDADAVLARMPAIAASTGSACSAGTPGPSAVLTAMGLSTARSLASLRFSLSRFSDRADVQDAAPVIIDAVLGVRRDLGLPTTRQEGLVHAS